MSSGPGREGTLLTIWGAGGSAPTGHPSRCRFGGDTVCFELRRLGEDAPPLIIDLGSAASRLGFDLSRRAEEAGTPIRAEVLLGHLHLDHVIGLPFFSPLYIPGSEIRLHCGLIRDAAEFTCRMERFAAPPFFPVEPLRLDTVGYESFGMEARFELAGFEIVTTPLNHPGGCAGFRITSPDGSVCVVGDHEHGDPAADARVRTLTEGATLMLYDGAFDAAEYVRYEGWGHSTWQAGLELAELSGVGRTLIYHHQPEHCDAFLGEIDDRVSAQSDRAALARQNMSVLLRDGETVFLEPDGRCG